MPEMVERFLERSIEDVPSLRAIFITAMPDCLVYASWNRDDFTLPVEDVASYFGDLVRANRQALKALKSWSSEMQVTIESADTMVVLREISADFVCGCVFEREAPLGMVRLHVKRVLQRVAAQLPSVAPEERPQGARVLEFLERYAPDPHTALLRVALRTGIAVERLRVPDGLTPAQVTKVEEAARYILGLRQFTGWEGTPS